MIKTIIIGGKAVPFKTSAATPLAYKMKFNRDLFADIVKIGNAYKNKNKKDTDFGKLDLETFFNIAYISAKQADSAVPDEPYEWLDGFEMFDIMTILPQILEMWNMEMATAAENKKKLTEAAGA